MCGRHYQQTGMAMTAVMPASSSSSSSGTELPLVFESYGLLNDIFPFPSILDAG
jgi:hypothetical protein